MRYVKALLLLLFFACALLFFMENFKSLSTPLALKLDLFITYSSSDAPAHEIAAPADEAPAVEAAPAKTGLWDDPVVPAGKKRLYWKAEAVPLYFVVIAAFVVGVLVTACFFILGRIRLSLESIRQTRRVRALEKALAALRAKAGKDQEAAGKQIKALETQVQKMEPQAAQAGEASGTAG